MSEELMTLLYICRVLPTLQMKAEVLNSSTIVRIAAQIVAVNDAVSVFPLCCTMFYECLMMFYIVFVGRVAQLATPPSLITAVIGNNSMKVIAKLCFNWSQVMSFLQDNFQAFFKTS